MDGRKSEFGGKTTTFSMGPIGTQENDGIGVIGAVRVGDSLLMSVPVRMRMKDWIMFNWLLRPETNDRILAVKGWMEFDEIWGMVKSGKRVGVDMDIITRVDVAPQAESDWLAWVERNNGRVPRGLIGLDEEGEEYMMGETLDGQHFRFFISNLRDGESVNFGDGPIQVEFERVPRAVAKLVMSVVMLVSEE